MRPSGNATRFNLEGKRNKFSKECKTQNEKLCIIISVLKEQTFHDTWELGVCFDLCFSLLCATSELGELRENSLSFHVLVHFRV